MYCFCLFQVTKSHVITIRGAPTSVVRVVVVEVAGSEANPSVARVASIRGTQPPSAS